MIEENKILNDGIILLNKNKGITSFSAINKLKKIVGCKKVGHAGTLDPMAEGLLIVMVNNATKFSNELMKKDKEYYVEMKLGYETDSYDADGKVTNIYEKDLYPNKLEIMNTLNEFLGEIEQIPPMYSAIKVNGEKLYNLARRGIEIKREARSVKINYISSVKYDEIEKKVSFYVGVSSGTYIRSLVRDVGQKLGVYATMTKLIRTKIDKFSLEKSIELDEIEKIDKFELINIEKILDYEKININKDQYNKLKNGMTVIYKIENNNSFNEKEKIKIYFENQYFVGIGIILKKDKDNLYLKREKYFL